LAQDLGFKVIRGQENRGAAFARNRLLEAASTPWVHFHDVDDTIDKTFNAKLSSFLASPDYAAMCAIRWVASDERDCRVFRLKDAEIMSFWEGKLKSAQNHSRIANELGFYYDSKTGPVGRIISRG
jgi:glycosyltransferase involved in cell wall biosynthesis